MPQSQLPEKPKFAEKATGIQKLLAGISGSMFVMALVTLIPFVENIFKPDGLLFLSTLRMAMAGIALFLGGCVGIPQIGLYIRWFFEFYEYYKKFKENTPDKEK